MRSLILIFFFIIISLNPSIADNANKFEIKEGNENANIKIYVYESLTCPHCADFHKKIYPNLKKNFIDTGIVEIYFKSFPLDLAGFNAAKITHCLTTDKRLPFLHHLFNTQKIWTKTNYTETQDLSTIEEINANIKKSLNEFGVNEIDFNSCINDEEIESWILEERIRASRDYQIQSTPMVVINGKRFDKLINYKNLKKAIEKMI